MLKSLKLHMPLGKHSIYRFHFKQILDHIKYVVLKKPELWLLLVPLLWGWGYPMIRASVSYTGAFSFLFYRFCIALFVMAILYRKQLQQSKLNAWRKGWVAGMALFAAYLFLNWGLKLTSTANAGFIIGFRVIVVPLLGFIIFKYEVAAREWLSAALALAGLVFIFVFSASSTQESMAGNGIIILSAIAFALHVLLVSYLSQHNNQGTFVFAQLAAVTVLSGAGMIVFEAPVSFPHNTFVWEDILLTGIFSTALAYSTQAKLQPYTTAGRTGIVFSAEPLFAAFFGFIYLGEALQGLQWIGAVIITAAVVLVQKPSFKRMMRPLRKVIFKRTAANRVS